MDTAAIRATIYFEPEIHKAIRLKAADTHRTLSDIVNEAVRAALREDQEDLAAFEDRVAEPIISYEATGLREAVWPGTLPDPPRRVSNHL